MNTSLNTKVELAQGICSHLQIVNGESIFPSVATQIVDYLMLNPEMVVRCFKANNINTEEPCR